ncbi:hypothetical protein Tco_1432008, partial [Tanacetum coccineum]
MKSKLKKHEDKQVKQSCLGEDCWELCIPDLVPLVILVSTKAVKLASLHVRSYDLTCPPDNRVGSHQRCAKIFAKKEALVNFLIDPSDETSTLRPAGVLVFWMGWKETCVRGSDR